MCLENKSAQIFFKNYFTKYFTLHFTTFILDNFNFNSYLWHLILYFILFLFFLSFHFVKVHFSFQKFLSPKLCILYTFWKFNSLLYLRQGIKIILLFIGSRLYVLIINEFFILTQRGLSKYHTLTGFILYLAK